MAALQMSSSSTPPRTTIGAVEVTDRSLSKVWRPRLSGKKRLRKIAHTPLWASLSRPLERFLTHSKCDRPSLAALKAPSNALAGWDRGLPIRVKSSQSYRSFFDPDRHTGIVH